ncbi:hypothetical protein M409DRAFT_17737 [Zasmidium cellare ATCC 36951]|uniref:Uncharacterized protein n=1 Tax=Zasmidium cellare ATCC 36951 TaxID=1080233 RepID=A0A6A6D0H1_ZASCE|nr:uncharacterized protein M409DRAFT_17737 [Zasmidium cellare ATCC 36951]KAF2172503.1 hypothetical protein M409DRAFT_17737 [Zasmidium cellare ATCC 36951]
MSYSPEQHAILLSLGIEQLPAVLCSPQDDEVELELAQTFTDTPPIRRMPVPGKRCPDCLNRGQVVWVIPGKKCQKCGREVN